MLLIYVLTIYNLYLHALCMQNITQFFMRPTCHAKISMPVLIVKFDILHVHFILHHIPSMNRPRKHPSPSIGQPIFLDFSLINKHLILDMKISLHVATFFIVTNKFAISFHIVDSCTVIYNHVIFTKNYYTISLCYYTRLFPYKL